MFGCNAPPYPEYTEEEFRLATSIVMPEFAGMQITEGPYGTVSSPGSSTGATHAFAPNSLNPERRPVSPELFIKAVQWIIDQAHAIKPILLEALVKDYWDNRDEAIDFLGDEDPAVSLPKIETPEELLPICGLVGVHVGGMTETDEPIFGIELGCNWNREEGAGVSFRGLSVVRAGEARCAFLL